MCHPAHSTTYNSRQTLEGLKRVICMLYIRKTALIWNNCYTRINIRDFRFSPLIYTKNILLIFEEPFKFGICVLADTYISDTTNIIDDHIIFHVTNVMKIKPLNVCDRLYLLFAFSNAFRKKFLATIGLA